MASFHSFPPEIINLFLVHSPRATLLIVRTVNKLWNELARAQFFETLDLPCHFRHSQIYNHIKASNFRFTQQLRYEVCLVHPRDLLESGFRKEILQSLTIPICHCTPLDLMVHWPALKHLGLNITPCTHFFDITAHWSGLTQLKDWRDLPALDSGDSPVTLSLPVTLKTLSITVHPFDNAWARDMFSALGNDLVEWFAGQTLKIEEVGWDLGQQICTPISLADGLYVLRKLLTQISPTLRSLHIIWTDKATRQIEDGLPVGAFIPIVHLPLVTTLRVSLPKSLLWSELLCSQINCPNLQKLEIDWKTTRTSDKKDVAEIAALVANWPSSHLVLTVDMARIPHQGTMDSIVGACGGLESLTVEVRNLQGHPPRMASVSLPTRDNAWWVGVWFEEADDLEPVPAHIVQQTQNRFRSRLWSPYCWTRTASDYDILHSAYSTLANAELDRQELCCGALESDNDIYFTPLADPRQQKSSW